jgi:prophage tail gpP-like protein
MAKRPIDRLTIESVDGDAGVFDRWTSFDCVNDLTAPAETSFECGDDGTFRSFEKTIAHGNRFRVVLNDRLRMTGRVEAHDVPTDAQGGATVRFVVRTKLADATFASANPKISIQGATLKDIILRSYSPLGYLESDFIFKTDVARDLMTGKSSKGKKKVDLEKLSLEQAKVNPPETIYEFVERHLLRFHLSHWDAPDGKIVVGAPDDQQAPTYRFILKFGSRGVENNVLKAHRVRDLSDAPSLLGVFGIGGKTDFMKSKIARAIEVPEVAQAKLYRPVLIMDEAIQNRGQAEGRVRREVAARSRRIDCWEVATDGLSFWDGRSAIPFGIDTTADVEIDTAGGATGQYLVHRTRLRRDPEGGDNAELTLIRKGLWVL